MKAKGIELNTIMMLSKSIDIINKKANPNKNIIGYNSEIQKYIKSLISSKDDCQIIIELVYQAMKINSEFEDTILKFKLVK